MTDSGSSGVPSWLANFPTTPARIVVTLALMIVSAVRYLVWGIPNEAGATLVFGITPWGLWMLTLTAWASVDVSQFALKRWTDRDYAAAKRAPTVNVAAPAAVSIGTGDPSIAATSPLGTTGGGSGTWQDSPLAVNPAGPGLVTSAEMTGGKLHDDVRAAHPTGEADREGVTDGSL